MLFHRQSTSTPLAILIQSLLLLQERFTSHKVSSSNLSSVNLISLSYSLETFTLVFFLFTKFYVSKERVTTKKRTISCRWDVIWEVTILPWNTSHGTSLTGFLSSKDLANNRQSTSTPLAIRLQLLQDSFLLAQAVQSSLDSCDNRL